ncbi:MAG: 50S ribosomal protein L25 [Verrucomicrobiae bacterium]|nr:50S ribosomal protein L25 [Verrucomicrobiae bacterium]MDW8308681.1 50S ribosomal protein L25 [Verrucomicrobiales bacterium]
MKSVPLKAAPRALTGRGGVKKLRAQGRVPAVIYGRNVPAENLELDARELRNLLLHSASENILVDLEIQNHQRAKRLAIVQEVQHHPLTGDVLHVDFHEVSENEKVTMMVPVETVGEAIGVKTGGGVLEHVLFKIKVRALPKDLPEQILVDVSHLQAGQSIHLGDIQPPPGVEILGDKSISVISIATPRVEEAPAAAEAVAPGEVEMIKEKKEAAAEAGAPEKPEKAEKAEKAAAAPTAEKKSAPAAEKKKQA